MKFLYNNKKNIFNLYLIYIIILRLIGFNINIIRKLVI